MEQHPTDPKAEQEKRTLFDRLRSSMPLLALILLIGLIVVLQSWINSEGKTLIARKAAEQAKEQLPVNVVAMELTPAPIQDRITLPGTVNPWVSLKMSAEVHGTIIDRKVEAGGRVGKGTILALIDDRDYRNAHASASASYKAAKASHDRIALLYKDQMSTRAQLDDAIALMETSRATMETTALQVERCVIRAPMDGIVDKLHIETGQYLGIGDPVALLIQIDKIKVAVGIPESDVDAVRRLRSFRVAVDALGGEVFEGRLHNLGKCADSLARNYPLEIAVDNSLGRLLPDMFARVEIVKRREEDALSVPLFTLIAAKNEQTVFLADSGKARQVGVETGIQDGWRIQIRKGLSAGSKVIVIGQRDIKEGAAINVVRTVRDPEELNR